MTLFFRRLLIPFCFMTGSLGIANAAPQRILLLDAAVAKGEIVAVGERGNIVRSPDAGQTWTKVASPTVATLTGVAFAPDGLRGWAVGHDALVLATTDGGHSWHKAYQGPNIEDSFLDVCVLDQDEIIVVGAYGQYLQSTDSGRTWQARRIQEEDLHLNRITRGPTGTLYVAGEHGTLLRSEDRGATWLNIAAPYDGSFFGILPLSNTELIAHGLRGRIYRSDDNGDNWSLVPNAKPVLIATACRLHSGEIVLAGQSRSFFISRDGGRSFAPWTLPLTVGVAQLLEAPDGRLLAFGEEGVTVLPKP